MQPLCILFAAPPVAGVTSIASFLSIMLGLPVFSNDQLRVETTIDKLKYMEEDPEYKKRQKERMNELLKSKKSFIYDASIDRSWEEVKKTLEESGYRYMVISINLSEDFLGKIYRARNIEFPKEYVDKWYNDHLNFIKDSKIKIDLNIDDQNYSKRLELCFGAVKAQSEN